MKNKLRTPQDYLDYFTRDFESDNNPQEIWVDLGDGRRMLKQFNIQLPDNLKIYHPYIVFIIFVNLKNYDFSGRWEKVAWEIPIKYKGFPFILAHRKFGFRIASNDESENVKNLALEAISNIHKSMRYAEILIEPEIKSHIQRGAITLDNKYNSINSRYEFFREKAKNEFDNKDVDKQNKEKEPFSSYKELIKQKSAGGYYLTSMLDAYYSFLEHTLVLLLPFVKGFDLSKINIETFIGFNWKDKYKTIFNLAVEKEALKILEKLDKIKENYRNPITHGYFQKNGSSFYVHMNNLGAIPMTLTNTHKYHFGRLGQFSFIEICKVFDEFDRFLEKNESTKYGIMYLKSGLSIAFDSHSCKLYQSAMKSKNKFESFIKEMTREEENAINMDW